MPRLTIHPRNAAPALLPTRLHTLLPALLLALLLIPALPVSRARAQVIFDAPGLLKQGPKTGPEAPRGAIAAWPRLDPGALLCRSQADLERHFQAVNARLSGTPFNGQAPDCRLINNPTGVKILSRQGPGRTKVQLDTARHEIGWTDTFLPARPPGSG